MVDRPGTSTVRCAAKQEIRKRPLIDAGQAVGLEATFKVLANGTRLRMLHALVREEELCVGDLAKTVGMKPQAVSNQLQRLVDKGIVAARRNGTQMFYRIVDPCVVNLLDQGLCLTEDLPGTVRPVRPSKGARKK